ncbi:MAG: hypothetical protein WC139_06345 [Candidatus Kapaibacterium sp.]
MNNSNSNYEELLYNLPDYVAGKITDENLLLRIQSELNSNPEFKAEYDLLSETYSAVKDMKFSEPPVHYFTNLVPKINEKINKQKESKGIAGFFRLSNLVKYALPAVSVVLLIFVITFSNKNDKDESMFTRYSDTISEIMKLDSETSNVSVDVETDTALESTEEEGFTDSDDASELSGIENENIIELYDENGDSEDEYFYYSDFETLSQIEQNELINTLSETKF